MSATATILKRVRKLLALATSPNQNEAASAKMEAERLMRLHGVSADEVADRTTVIVEEHFDDFAKDLSRAVTEVAGLTLLWNKNGQIAFAGLPVDVAVAAEAYSELRDRARAGAVMPAFALPLPEEAQLAWRAFYLSGFAAAVERSVQAQEKVQPKPQTPKEPEGPIDWGDERKVDEPVEAPKEITERSPVREMLAFRNRYTNQDTVKWLCDLAYSSGEIAGLNASRDVTFRRTKAETSKSKKPRTKSRKLLK